MRLSKVVLNGTTHDISNVVVVIGANNAGKTTFLRDLFEELTNTYERDQYGDFVARSTQSTLWNNMISRNGFEFSDRELKMWLDSHRDWKPASPPNNEALMRSRTHTLQWHSNETGFPERLYFDLKTQIAAGNIQRDDWLTYFKKSHIGHLQIDERFTTANNISSIDAQNLDSPYLLYLRDNIIDAFNEHLEVLFSRILVSVKTSMTAFSLIAIDKESTKRPVWANSNNLDDELDTVAAHTKFLSENETARIEQQSHGTRAAMTLLMSLIDQTRKILFIDEPESHIYPSARKYIANLISEQSGDRQFFIVSHDTEFLEGIAGSGRNFTIIKINRNREATVINFDAAERRRTASELKNSNAIRAGFYDSAIFVEGTGDRYVYGNVIKRKGLMPSNIEYGLIDCDGVDKVASSVKFAKDIGTKVAVIVDFDAITGDKKKMNDGTQKVKLNLILASLNAEPSLSDRVTALRDSLKGRTNAKKGLANPNLSKEEKVTIRELLKDLSKVGVFVVPRGELYDWFLKLGKDVSIPVETLRNKYEHNTTKYGALTTFLTKVCKSVV